jgi:ABC-type dipeptide/oligopeptide/nickel transport system ATPase subunit
MIEIIMGDSGVGKTTYLKKELLKYSQYDVAYLPQEVSGIFNPLSSMQSQIFEMKFNAERFKFLLNKLNLKDLDLKRYPHEFSTGELQRFALLIIFLRDIKKIFLDEPTSSLDLENQSALIEIIKLQKVSCLITTHNLDFAISITNNIKIIKNGKLENFNNSYKKKDAFSQILEKNYKKILDNEKIFDFLMQVSTENILQTVLIFGKSGYGKTNLLQKMYDLLIKNNQKAVFLGQNYGFSFSPQRTILQTLKEVINFREKKIFSSKKDAIEIIKIFRQLKLSNKLLKRYPHELSQGEKQRILIIRAILLNTKTLLLDEPTSSLDFQNEKNLLNFLLKTQSKYGLNLVIVSHSQFVINSLVKKSKYLISFKEQFKFESYQSNILK